MILNSKQLEELESIHDTVAEFEEEGAAAAAPAENENFDEGAESALAWRRGMIERAAANVKKICRKHIDPQTNYPAGVLLFDRQAKRFGRATSSSTGLVKIAYLTGGDSEIRHSQIDMVTLGDHDDASANTEPKKAKQKDKPQLVATPAMTKARLQKKEDADIDEMVAVDSLMASETPGRNKKKIAAKAAPKAPKPTLKTVTKSKPQKKVAKPVVTKKKTAKAKPKAKPVARKALAKPKKSSGKASKKTGKKKAAIFASYLPAGAITDPVADPNGYIKQHFRLMSNKELANITGLSEHTIRRKLGEWGLKRPSKMK